MHLCISLGSQHFHTLPHPFSHHPRAASAHCCLTSAAGMNMAQDAKWWHWGDISCQAVHVTLSFWVLFRDSPSHDPLLPEAWNPPEPCTLYPAWITAASPLLSEEQDLHFSWMNNVCRAALCSSPRAVCLHPSCLLPAVSPSAALHRRNWHFLHLTARLWGGKIYVK